MCGIAGFWGDRRCALGIGERMATRIESRGPDGAGVWGDHDAGLVLAHRRLSILDLSPAGHQPMHSPCDRYVLAYNGEIYNHLDLRQELEAEGGAFDWRGHSDTETLLAGLRHWECRAYVAKAQWHVCLRALGCLGTDSFPGPRQNGGKTTVLRLQW